MKKTSKMTSKIMPKRYFETPAPHASVLKPLIPRDLGLVCGRAKIRPFSVENIRFAAGAAFDRHSPTRQYADVDAKVLARKFM